MVSRITTVAFNGIEALSVDVQVQLTSGQPSFVIVGLPDKTVAESKERIRAALYSFGLSLPAKRIIVNLAPADLPKEGSHYDLPIALGILVSTGIFDEDQLTAYVALGELGLDGTIAAVVGVLPSAIHANTLGKGLICPEVCGSEAVWASPDLIIVAGRSLIQLVNHFKGTQLICRPEPVVNTAKPNYLDFKDIKGQVMAKRALEVAAAGGHNILMIGPPGVGKSMLAERLPSILPPLAPHELLEVSMLASISGELQGSSLSNRRPFRAPHHSASVAALVGGGTKVKPGEISLAHHGILFLDELPEFHPHVLNSLRQPMESGTILIARANLHVVYPARIQLVAAMNPCRCGRYGELGFRCKRGDRCAGEYRGRISGPLLDRIDITINVPELSTSDLISTNTCDSSSEIVSRVISVREKQAKRLKLLNGNQQLNNATMTPAQVEQIVKLDSSGRSLMENASKNFKLSARGYHRVLKVARTLADLDHEENVCRRHLAEAIVYRGPGNYV